MKKLTTLIFLAVCIIANAQNYTVQTSTGTSSDFNFQTTGSTIMTSGNDVLSTLQTIPFSFTFYGQSYTSFYASDNGYITFNTTATTSIPNNTTLPSTNAPTNAIFAFWDDLNIVSGGAGAADLIHSFTYGTAPNRVHVIQWFSVTPNSGSGYLYAAIRLYETACGREFDVLNHYGNATGMSGTIGCQDANATNGTEVVGSPNLSYPTLAQAGTDDIIYSFSTVSSSYDISITGENNVDEVMAIGSVNLNIEVTNKGTQAVNNFDLHYSVNGGATQSSPFTTFITSNNNMSFSHTIPFNPSTPGQFYEIKIWADNIDGNNDELNCNDTLTKMVWVNNGISGTKNVLLEEFTTEPCGYCPDGTLVVEQINNQYPYVVAVGHHAGFNTDFLTTSFHTSYANDMANGAPTAAIDRYDFDGSGDNVAISRSIWSSSAVQMYNEITPVNISINDIIYDATTNTVDAMVNLDFVDYAQPGDLVITFWVVEDSIIPQNQINYYSSQSSSGGAGGSSHQYYTLPYNLDPTNANDYQHRHVSMTVETATWGDAISITNPIPNDTYQQAFTNISLNGMDAGQVYLVAVVSYHNTDKAKRLVLNVTEEHVDGMVSAIKENSVEQKLNTYPNPVNEIGFIEFELANTQEVIIDLYNIIGEKLTTVIKQKYAAGKHHAAFNSSELSNGTYFLKVKTNIGITTVKVVVTH
ncbi:MAG: Omp28-related outer membrane protein [Flavobacteriales bacterium]|nr:Omp28-related outer membrane protein [Flavobacteriales bacterium]